MDSCRSDCFHTTQLSIAQYSMVMMLLCFLVDVFVDENHVSVSDFSELTEKRVCVLIGSMQHRNRIDLSQMSQMQWTFIDSTNCNANAKRLSLRANKGYLIVVDRALKILCLSITDDDRKREMKLNRFRLFLCGWWSLAFEMMCVFFYQQKSEINAGRAAIQPLNQHICKKSTKNNENKTTPHTNHLLWPSICPRYVSPQLLAHVYFIGKSRIVISAEEEK